MPTARFISSIRTLWSWAASTRLMLGMSSLMGVQFERWEGMPQDELGIWNAPGGARVAWFKDPDGNVLSLSQHPA